MERMKCQVMSRDEDENEGCDPSKIMARQGKKPHRKLLSGLKLFKTVNANNSDPWMKRNNEVIDVKIDRVFTEQIQLPHHLITHHILTRLSVKTLLQFKSISKEWYSAISSSEFANLHLGFCVSSYRPWCPVECLFIQAEDNYYILYYQEEDEVLHYYFVKLETDFDDQKGRERDELHLVGSCNGLVCLVNASSSDGYFYIWNPITRCWRKFSDPYPLSFQYRTSWGFAYVSSVDDYKVVRLVQNCNTLEIVVHVFSLKTGQWKQVHHHGLDCQVSLTKTNPGVLADATLYWLVDTSGPNRSLTVVGFDLSLEKFDKIHDLAPRSINPWHQFLCVMGGCLSICGLNKLDEVYISILRRSGEVESICLPSDLVVRLCSAVVGFTSNGRFFVVSKNWELALVYPTMSPKQYTPLITFRKGRRPCMVSYNPSLVSPSAISGLQQD